MKYMKKLQAEASYYYQNHDKKNCSNEFIRGVCSGVEYVYKNHFPFVEISEKTRLNLIAITEKFLEAEKAAYKEIFSEKS